MNWAIKIISKNINDQYFAHFMRGYDKGFYDIIEEDEQEAANEDEDDAEDEEE